MVKLSDLPDLVLVTIFRELDLQELLTNVAFTNKRFHQIVHGNSTLWRHFSMEHQLEVSIIDLRSILKHSVAFLKFCIPCATLHFSSADIDFLLVKELCNAKSLYWLDLTSCRLSTLCFLPFLSNIEILNLSECGNLVSEDFEVISSLKKLDQLYLSFTNITPETIVRICEPLTLTLLDISGIPLTIQHCARILTPNLLFFHLTLESQEDEIWLNGLLARQYKELSVHIYRN